MNQQSKSINTEEEGSGFGNIVVKQLNKLFNSSVVTMNEVQVRHLEGVVTGYNKAYKTEFTASTRQSSHADTSWNHQGGYYNKGDVSLSTYVSTTISGESFPVIDFWIEYDGNGGEEMHTVIQEVPMREGHRLRLSYLTLDGRIYYLYQIANQNSGNQSTLIFDTDFVDFIKKGTKNHFSMAMGVAVGLLFLLFSQSMGGLIVGAVGGYFFSKRIMLSRNIETLNTRIGELNHQNYRQ